MISQRVTAVIAVPSLVLCMCAAVGWALRRDQSFTIVLIPDTQNFNEEGGKFLKDDTYRQVTEHIKSLSGDRVALHLGDVTDSQGESSDDGNEMMLAASEAHRVLDDADIPYLITPGNHDHKQISGDSHRLTRPTALFDWHFPPARFQKPWYVGHFPPAPGSNQNSAITFEGGGNKFLAIGLDHVPTKDAVCWADSLIRAHSSKLVIVTTHCYQSMGEGPGGAGTTHSLAKCATDYRLVGMSGDDLWDELLDLHSNLFMVASGHWQGGAFHTITTNQTGTPVEEVLVDYQDERLTPPGGKARKHGNGWIKLLEYDQARKVFEASPHSVLDETRFNIRDFDDPVSDDDVCSATRPCYDPLPSSLHHTFTLDIKPARQAADEHRDPIAFTDRFINEAPAGDQRTPDLAMTGKGDIVVTWADDSEPPSGQFEVFARSLRANGCAASPAFKVNTNSRRQQQRPVVAADDAGHFVVAWQDDANGPKDLFQIYARGLATDGVQRFYSLVVNQVADGSQTRPAIAMRPDGRFAVAWQDSRQDASDVFVRGFSPAGGPLFGDVLVTNGNQRAGSQVSPQIGMTAAGDMAVAWISGGKVLVRRLSADGVAMSPILTVTSSGASQVEMSFDPTGAGALAWIESGKRVKLARIVLNPGGAALVGGVTDVHSTATSQAVPNPLSFVSLGFEPTSGSAIVAWEDDSDRNGSTQIMARRFTSAPNGWTAVDQNAWTVNKDCHGEQTEPRAGLVMLGQEVRWAIAWTDDLDNDNVTQILVRGGRFDDSKAGLRAQCY